LAVRLQFIEGEEQITCLILDAMRDMDR